MVQELLSELYQRGIKLRLTNGQLDVLAPAGSLTSELRERLKLERDDLIALLSRSSADESLPRITPQPELRHDPFPLTDLQHAYWVGRGSAVELGGVSSHYYFELERSGLDIQRLNESLRKVIARHDMLRTIVRPDGSQQTLPDVPEYEIAAADLRDLAPDAREEKLAQVRAEMDHRVVQADHWPVLDIRACLLDGGRLRLHIGLDMLIMDGLSLYMLFGEWRRFYEEPDWNPEPLSLSYRDCVLHDAALRDGTQYKADEAYWLGRIESLPPHPALPLAVQPNQLRRTRFTRRGMRIPVGQWTTVKRIAQGRGLTPSVVLITAFADVLRVWSSQPGFTLNLTLFNRPSIHPQINQVIGDFTTVTLLAIQTQPDAPFAIRAGAVQQQLVRDMEHLGYSGVRVLRERGRILGGGPGAAMPVVFTSALVLSSPDEDPSDGIGFFGEQVYAISQTPQVWLDHQVTEEHGDLVFNWDAVEDLFPAGVLDDMFSAYCGVLDQLIRDTRTWDQPGSLATLPDRQLSERDLANDTAADIPDQTLCGLVEEQARQHPSEVAVISDEGQLSYAELVSLARRLARCCGEPGATANTLVGVVLDKGWEQVAAVLGINLCGAAYLPIDPQWPAARRQQLLTRGAVRVVVTTPSLREELDWPEGIELVTFADPEILTGDDDPLGDAPAPQDLAYVIYTSGSTGQPKGVAISHRGAVNTILDINRRFGIGPRDRVLALSALSFDLSVYDIFGILAAGGAVVMPSQAHAHDPANWADLAQRHGVTIWNSVPALMQAWVDAHGQTAPPASTLHTILLSGDWIPVSLPGQIRALHPQAALISLGGATEASIWSVCYPIGEVHEGMTRIPYGKPLANQTLHVYDARFEPCPVWTTGEIYIGGTGLALGYWADQERTDERFVTNPKTSERLYRTGDLGRYLPGGDIEFLGREDSQVKLNGYRIELGEIAAALRQQAGVGEAIVSVDANPATNRRQLVAHVVPAGDQGQRESTHASAAWQSVVEAAQAELRQSMADLASELAAYRNTWRIAEELCPSIMARTLRQLGLFAAAGDSATAQQIVARCGVKPGYADLLEQWMSTLTTAGLLAPGWARGGYGCERALDLDQLNHQVRDGLAVLATQQGQRVLFDYFTSCAENQVGLLRGQVSPLQLLLPGGDTRVTDALYATNPVSRMQNRVAARIVRSFTQALPAQCRARILEVGAGTGATSAEVLRELPADRFHYWFTDVSTYFTERAKAKFRDYPSVEYGVFDIDREPAGQGFTEGSVDVVIAANVMHDAKDVTRSLDCLRSVLAPGGILVLIEGTVNSLQQAVTVGFIEGLTPGRNDNRLPLLPVPKWREHVDAAGFTRFAAIPDADAAIDAHVQHVLVGQAPAGRPRLNPGELRQELTNLLPDYMVPRHYVVIDQLPLTANGKIDRSALPSPWSDTAQDERVAPRDDLELRLFEIFRDTLERDDFGVEDNFFEIGGDSLHAVRILGRLREEFGMEANADEGLEMLFDSPTIAELAITLRDLPEA